jgi:hypothetical protein
MTRINAGTATSNPKHSAIRTTGRSVAWLAHWYSPAPEPPKPATANHLFGSASDADTGV